MQDSGVFYIAFGRLDDRTLLYHFCFEEKYDKKFTQEAQSLLLKLQPLKLNPGDHQKIKSSNGSWYCTFDYKRIAYLALCNVYYSETEAYRMLSEMQASVQIEIPTYWQSDKTEITTVAKKFIPDIAEKFKNLEMHDIIEEDKEQLDQSIDESLQKKKNIASFEIIEEKAIQMERRLEKRLGITVMDDDARIQRRKWRTRILLFLLATLTFAVVIYTRTRSTTADGDDE